MKTVKPLGKRVVVKRLDAKTSKGGILLPDSAQERPKQGVVIAVGPGEVDEKGNLQAISLKEGDAVLFSSFAGTEYKVDEENDYLIMSADDILAVMM